MFYTNRLIVVFISFFGFNTAFCQLSNSLILNYSFDGGDASDVAGNQDGIVHGAVLCNDRFGNPNMAYSFSDDSIVYNNLTFGTLTEASFSIWLNPDPATLTGPKATPMSCGVWGAYINRYNSNGTMLSFMDGSTGDNSALNETGVVPSSGWFHYLTTNDGVTTKNYINGLLQSQYPENFLWVESSYTLYLGILGYGPNGHESPYNGELDDFRIYNRSLTVQEVDSVYNSPNPTLSISEITSTENLAIYPNPSEGVYTIDFSGELLKWKLFDPSGRLIISDESNSKVINISSLPDGVYILSYTDDNAISGSKLIHKMTGY